MSAPSPATVRPLWQPILLGVSIGACLGILVLVVAPLFDTLDTHVVVAGGSRISERNYLLPGHWKLLALCVGVAGALGGSLLRQPPLRYGVSLVAGVMCAWAIRVGLDLAHDPTDHNLLPFEAIGDAILLLIGAVPAAYVGYVIGKRADRDLKPWSPSWKRGGSRKD